MKPTERTSVPDPRVEITQRLRSAAGHLAGVIRMTEAAKPTADVLHQLGAVQGALRATERLLLRSDLQRSSAILQDDPDPARREAELRRIQALYVASGTRFSSNEVKR